MRGMDPLALMVEQLWGPAVVDDAVRIAVGPPGPGWVEQESYWMFPTADRAKLLLPRGPRAVTAAAATNYRGMRRPTKNLGRSAMGVLARSGVPLSPARLSVSVRSGRADVAAGLPLATLAEALGVDVVHAASGVRGGANRKATLHLLGATGEPLGYAKFGWNAITDHFVRTEGSALRAVGGRVGPMRAPALLAEVDYHGHPVIVTEPLPLDVRGARSRSLAPPSPQELFSLCPVVRQGRVRDTEHFGALVDRIELLDGDAVAGGVVEPARSLLTTLRSQDGPVPVTARWHGDLAPWNRARDRSGQLWVWDWETAEPDAVAGLDALHWAFSVRRPASGRNSAVDLAGCLRDAASHLRAAGVHPDRWGDVAAVYALTVAERAAGLALRAGGWDRLWIGPEHLGQLLDQAAALTTSSR
jgi:hypothetical protein